MSAPIANSTPTSVGLPGADTGARPQLQSRRMSLKLGPLGVTYATDQVLWTDAAAGATTGAVSGAVASQRTEQEAASQAEARQEAQQTGRSFSQELLEAWRRQVQERVESSVTYGPDGARRGVANAGGAVEPGESTEESQGQGDGQEGQTDSQADTRADSPPVARVRRAITAYLACARQFGQARPMLSAVA